MKPFFSGLPPRADWCHVLQKAWPNTWRAPLWYLPSGWSKRLCHPVRRQCPFITLIITGRSGVSTVCLPCLSHCTSYLTAQFSWLRVKNLQGIITTFRQWNHTAWPDALNLCPRTQAPDLQKSELCYPLADYRESPRPLRCLVYRPCEDGCQEYWNRARMESIRRSLAVEKKP